MELRCNIFGPKGRTWSNILSTLAADGGEQDGESGVDSGDDEVMDASSGDEGEDGDSDVDDEDIDDGDDSEGELDSDDGDSESEVRVT
jgi:hypothetical protein